MSPYTRLELARLTAEDQRIADVLDHARAKLPTGMFTDEQALRRAEELGLVKRVFKGPLGFVGLSYLHLTDAGSAAIEA